MLNRRLNIIALILVFVMLMSMVAFTAYEPFKVKLGLFNRLVCLGLLPPEGNFATLKIVRELQMELAPTEEESEAAGVIPDLLQGGVTVDPEKGWNKVEDKEIIFGDIAKGLIVKALKDLEAKEKLTQQHYDIYRWFVLEEKQEEAEVIGGEDSYNPNIEEEKVEGESFAPMLRLVLAA